MDNIGVVAESQDSSCRDFIGQQLIRPQYVILGPRLGAVAHEPVNEDNAHTESTGEALSLCKCGAYSLDLGAFGIIENH